MIAVEGDRNDRILSAEQHARNNSNHYILRLAHLLGPISPEFDFKLSYRWCVFQKESLTSIVWGEKEVSERLEYDITFLG